MPHITGLDAIRSKFGHWPDFHDAEVLRLFLDRTGPSLRMDLLMPAKAEPGQPRYRVDLVFESIDAQEFSDFNHQNVLFSLTAEPVTEEHTVTGKVEDRLRVRLEASFGLHGSFTCTSAAALLVEKGVDE